MQTAKGDHKIPDSVIESAKGDIVGVVSKYLDLKKTGKDYSALCPFHSEKTPSFTVSESKGIFHCFGCGAQGDSIDFVMRHDGLQFHEAVQSITGHVAQSGAAPVKKAPAPKASNEGEWTPITPVPNDHIKPTDAFHRRKGDGWERMEASRRWAYHDGDGNLLGYICRFELPGGGKDLIPQSYCVNSKTGEVRWKWMSFAKPRPIYGLDKLARNPDAQVMVIEGEKACDAAQTLYEGAGIPQSKLVTVAWPGGGKAVKHVDWSPLTGRKVGLWPDADQKHYVFGHAREGELMDALDQPGIRCMLDIAERLQGVAASIKIVTPPAGVPDGWDLADPAPEGFNLLQHSKTASLGVAEFIAAHTPAPASEPAQESPAIDASEDLIIVEPPAQSSLSDDQIQAEKLNGHFFTVLGYNSDEYYVFAHAKKQVLIRTKSHFTEHGMVEMAPLDWWEEHFLNMTGKGGLDKVRAFEWFVQVAHARGIFDHRKVRGRGAWRDNGRIIFHHGSHLSVDGERVEVAKLKGSDWVYPMSQRLPSPHPQPLTDEEGAYLVKVAGMARWTRPASAALLAGWTFLAPICGALSWRPHIWITGAAGSGKSTLFSSYCGTLLDGIGLQLNGGNSSEAGIRSQLGCDAIPVLLDEFEPNEEADRKSMRKILTFIRQSSSESQALTVKGSASGEVVSFHTRSMFCLASINTMLDKQSDETRITKLTLKPAAKSGSADDQWEKLQEELHKIGQDPRWASRILARGLQQMENFGKSSIVFRRVAAKRFGTQRLGDQYGTILAGTWTLMHSYPASEEDALALINMYDWSEHTESSVGQSDPEKALSSILESKIRVSMSDVTVYELIAEASGSPKSSTIVGAGACADILRRYGMIVEGNQLLFGVLSNNLKSLVKDTPYATDLRGQLSRLQGATNFGNRVRRFAGTASKVISVPLGLVLDDDEPPI